MLWAKNILLTKVATISSPEDNYIKLLNYPLLIKTPDSLVLVETGLGNKLSAKQKQIFRVIKDWSYLKNLINLGSRGRT